MSLDQQHWPDVSAVVGGRRGRTDPDAPPPPIECVCGRFYPWVWWEGFPERRIRARWTPAVGLDLDTDTMRARSCQTCAAVRELEEAQRRLAARQHTAGIPPIYREYRWEQRTFRAADEPWPAFVRRVRLAQPRQIGVSTASRAAAHALYSWRPEHGSLYVSGPVGAGKTLMACATATELLGGVTERVEVLMGADELDRRWGAYGAEAVQAACSLRRDRRIRPGGVGPQVLYVAEEDLVQRIIDAWSGDRDPLRAIAAYDVLILDDIGVVASTSGKRAEVARTTLRRLISYRYDHHLPLIITSNIPVQRLDSILDRRSLDRLHELVEGRHHTLEGLPRELTERGWSWRRPPPAEVA